MLCRLQSGIDDIKKKADESDHITITLWKEDIQALKQDIKSQGDREKMAALLLQVKEINDNISRYVNYSVELIIIILVNIMR